MQAITIDEAWNFVPLYMLLLEKADGTITLAKAKDEKGPMVATVDNMYLLQEMGDRLLESKEIIGYQLAKTITYPKRVY
jgi:hypothetical protein